MAYGSEGLEGRGQRGGRIQDDSRAYRNDVEEEPTDLDAPESDGLDDDELEDVAISAVEVDDEDSESDDEKEAASPLAEDAPIGAEEDEEDEDGAEASESYEEDEEGAGAAPARGEAGVMSAGARRRQFPAAGKVTLKGIKVPKAGAGGKRAAGTRRKTRRVKLARA